MTRPTQRAGFASWWLRGQNVNFNYLMQAMISEVYVALVTAHVVATEYFKETNIYKVRKLSAYEKQLKFLKYFKEALRVCTS